jgi:predicted O-linked N-acetylglucosamine transferase (SPINDLY family)
MELFSPAFDDRALLAEAARWEEQHAAPLRRFILPHANRPDADRRLKVGYVSPNFWRHVICHFLAPLLEGHDHAAFEIYCYASVKRPDQTTARFRKSADVWRDVLGMSDEALSAQVRADGIDILVDLTQHMADSRLLAFARKPAPVQVAWLAYPGTTGLRSIDYRFTDAWLEPDGAPGLESVERPVRLPDSWFCFDPIDEYPQPGELPALRTGQVSFGCLNNFCKVNDAVLQLWARVLQAVPGSRLLLRCPPDSATRDRVWQFFASQGIAAERVELLRRTRTREEFLQLFARIDVALDPFPYNGGTTTCEALWMGIPVLTLPGAVAVSRLGLSILSTVGVAEFVAGSEEAYVQLAARLAGDLPRLAQLRSGLRARMQASVFMDGPRFARNVEHAYRDLWRAWCAQQAPAHL